MRPILIILLAAVTPACALFEKNDSPTSPTPVTPGPPAAGAAVVYTAIGASDTTGFGSTSPCEPFADCPNGTGYVQIVARSLRTSRQVTVANRGVPSALLSPAMQAIAREYGRNVIANFVDGEVPFVPGNTTLVTIFGGSNDVDRLTEAIERGAGAANVRDYADAQIRAFGADYDRLVRGIRDRAPNAFIVVMNLPNSATLPYATGYDNTRRRLLQHISVGFSREANRQAAQGIVVIDLMCDARIYDRANFSSDGFHPSDIGYEYLAQRILAVVNGASSTPAASCAQMTVLPPL